jgi:putative transposase
MKDEIQQERIRAVQRFLNDEKPESICASLGRSKAWLYKWVERHIADDNSWSESQSKRPLRVTSRTPKEIEEIVKMVRLNLYNRDLFCGAQAILWEMDELGIRPLPSLRTINRILVRNELTHRRTGRYEAKGTPYPKLPSLFPNQTHQADLVGPCYLKGPVRFYGLNAVDMSTARCGLYRLISFSTARRTVGSAAATSGERSIDQSILAGSTPMTVISGQWSLPAMARTRERSKPCREAMVDGRRHSS